MDPYFAVLWHHFVEACYLNPPWKHFFQCYIIKALWYKAHFNFSWKSRTPTLHLALFHLQVNIWRAGLRWQITLSYHPPPLFWPLSCPQSCLTYIQSKYNLDGYAANCWLPDYGKQHINVILKVMSVFGRGIFLQWYRVASYFSCYFFHEKTSCNV